MPGKKQGQKKSYSIIFYYGHILQHTQVNKRTRGLPNPVRNITQKACDVITGRMDISK